MFTAKGVSPRVAAETKCKFVDDRRIIRFMKLTKQQLRSIIKEELTPGEKGVQGAKEENYRGRLNPTHPNVGLHVAINKAIENLANVFVRVNVRAGADETYAETVAERLVDGVEALVSDLEEEFN